MAAFFCESYTRMRIRILLLPNFIIGKYKIRIALFRFTRSGPGRREFSDPKKFDSSEIFSEFNFPSRINALNVNEMTIEKVC